MEVREATPADAPAVRDVHQAAVTELGRTAYADEQVTAWANGSESLERLEATIADADYYVVAEDEGIVGFGRLEFDTDTDYAVDVDAEVTAVYVHPGATRRGIGSAILHDLESEALDRGARTVGLWASRNAIPFYEEHGYEQIGERIHSFSASARVTGTVVEMVTVL